MENYSLFAAEYGFILKMSVVAFGVVVAGVLIRKRSSHHHSEAD